MYIIFGSTGFIGKNLYHKLININGKKVVQAIGRNSTKIKNLDLTIHKNFEKIPNHKYDCVYAFAGKSNFILNDIKKENLQKKTNIKIINNIINFCKKNQVKKIIFLSSSAVYSISNSLPLNERQKISPKNSLGLSKHSIEKKLKLAFKKTSTKIVILRVFTVYGKDMRKEQFLYQAIKKFKSSKKKLLFWNKDIFRNFIHIDDLINIIIKFTNEKMPKYSIYNVASNKSHRIGDIIYLLNGLSKDKKEINFKSNTNNLSHNVNTNKINKKFGLSFKNFKKGLVKLYEKI